MSDKELPNDTSEASSEVSSPQVESGENTGEVAEPTDMKSDEPSQLSDHTPETTEIQAQELEQKPTPSVRKAPKTFEEHLEFYIQEVTARLAERERLKLSYVDLEIPEPYFKRWVGEANRDFAVLVRLKRRRAMLQKEAS